MRIYVDGTALSRYLVDDVASTDAADEHDAWVRWAAAHEADLVTTAGQAGRDLRRRGRY